MTDIYIHFTLATDANASLSRAIYKMEDIRDTIKQIQSRLPPEFQARHEIASQLKVCQEKAETIRRQIKSLYNVVDQSVTLYRITEKNLNEGFQTTSIITTET